MHNIDNITMIENVTLISINDSPADFKVVAQIFEMLSNAGIDVDMISQFPPEVTQETQATANISFRQYSYYFVLKENIIKVP